MRTLAACLVVCAISSSALADDKDVLYDASMAADKQIALARSAAPGEVSNRAAIYILGKHGYERVIQGDNGFSCLVDRELTTTMEPECFDAEGSATTLLVRMRVEELRAKGKSEDLIRAEIDKGYKSKQFKAPTRPGIVYMLSDQNYVFDPSSNTRIHFPGHLMFYAPYLTDKDLGYQSSATLPYLVHPGQPDALMIVIPQVVSHQH